MPGRRVVRVLGYTRRTADARIPLRPGELATGVCVVPLSGFCSDLSGLRMPLLESDEQKRRGMLNAVTTAIRAYGA